MSDTAIRVENLGKRYRIGALQARHDTLRDQIASAFRRGKAAASADNVWALKEVSFVVKKGEAVGIVGRNGAGKSTLLKILSRITEPTEGKAALHGRIASLLEVGTGFHSELTGRENVYLSGAILGMRKAETHRRFDEIIAFAEVEKFIDTPVKHYSSGMYLRLAFSVAAHLKPDLLFLDEILGVGDLAFREKCFQHLRTLREDGVTILVVSHYLAQVSVLTRRCVWLDRGGVRKSGSTDEVLASYHNELRPDSGDGSAPRLLDRQVSSGKIELIEVRTVDAKGRRCNHFEMGDDIVFECDVRVLQPGLRPRFGLSVYTSDGVKVLMQNTRLQGDILPACVDRDGTIRLRLSTPPFLAGDYTVWAGIGSDESNSADYAAWPDCHGFSILVPNVPNAEYFAYTEPLNGTGMIRWDGSWEIPWR